MKKKTFIEKFRKSLNSITVLTLLLPNIMSIGVVTAEELNSDEPQIENVEEMETEETDLEVETNDEGDEEPAVEENETPSTPESEEPIVEEELDEETTESLVTSEEEIAEDESVVIDETPQDTFTPAQATPDQVPGIIQENLVYENGILTLHNQIDGTNIAAVLPNGSLIYSQVPFHGRWSPRQNLIQNKIYVGDEIEFFTYSGTDLGESIFLTVEGEGETRPADQYAIQYSRQHFGFIPTTRDSRVSYRTEAFFTVEMTFPNGEVETKRSSSLGQVSFDFEENGYTARPGHVFSVRVFDRNNNLIDLRDPDLFADPSKNQVETKIPGDPIPEEYTVTIDPNGGTLNEEYRELEAIEGENFSLPARFRLALENLGMSINGFEVDGILLDADGEQLDWIPDYSSVNYTVESDVTLTTIWEITTGNFHLRIYDDELREEQYEAVLTNTKTGVSEDISLTHLADIRYAYDNEEMPYGTYNLSIDGYKVTSADIRGWKIDEEPELQKDGSVTFFLDFSPNYSANHSTLDLRVEPIPETNTVTIDPNGGTIDEAYASVEVPEADTYTVPYTFQSNLALPGYTLTGYAVEGRLLDANGEPVTELSRYTGTYTPESDVTLTANWEITSGGFRIQLYDDAPGSQKERYTLTLIAEDGTEYELSSNQSGSGHRTWRVEDVPNGIYTLVIDGYRISEGEEFGQPDTTSDFVVNDDGTATVELEFVDNKSPIFIRYKVYGEPVPEIESYPLGIEVRDLDGVRTSDVTVYVQNEDFVVFSGSYNEYNQWLTDEELPVGEYTITLQTPANTYAVVQDTTQQHAESTDRQNVFTILVNEENRGNLSAVYGAFQLVEMEYRLGIEVRGLDGKRTSDVGVVVTNEDEEVFEGAYNEYLQWLTEEELPAGEYIITLDTPEGTVAEINDFTGNYAVPTDVENVFTIQLNETNLGSSSAIYGAFQLVEVPVEIEQYLLGVEVRDLDNLRTSEVGIVVTNADDEVFTGDYNQYLQWLTDEELPVGEYTITLTTPEGTRAVINDTVASQKAVATDEENVFTILVNAENKGSLSAVYGAFRLVEVDEEEPTDPEEPVDPEEPTVPDPDPEDPTDPDDPDPTDPEKPTDPEEPTDPEKPADPEDSSSDLPLTGVATSAVIGLGITSILSGLGLIAINKKREDE